MATHGHAAVVGHKLADPRAADWRHLHLAATRGASSGHRSRRPRSPGRHRLRGGDGGSQALWPRGRLWRLGRVRRWLYRNSMLRTSRGCAPRGSVSMRPMCRARRRTPNALAESERPPHTPGLASAVPNALSPLSSVASDQRRQTAARRDCLYVYHNALGAAASPADGADASAHGERGSPSSELGLAPGAGNASSGSARIAEYPAAGSFALDALRAALEGQGFSPLAAQPILARAAVCCGGMTPHP